MPVILKSSLFSGHPLRHGFSTRDGGVSSGEFNALNLSLTCGDEPKNVIKNRELYFAALGSDPTAAVYCQQIHSNNLVEISEQDRGRGAQVHETAIVACDGLVTACEAVPLNIITADCVSVLFYDPIQHVAAACHAGWSGSAAAIVDAVIGHMHSLHGSKAANIVVAMGPSASGCCYEVDEKVVSQLEDGLSLDYVRPGKAQRFMVDLRSYNTLRLLRLGVKPSNVELVGGCSICGTQFFSHRRQKGQAGRMLATIELLRR